MENPELKIAWEIISNTDTHLFLTGKAGTGKTTFLRELRQALPKRMIVVAPTGIAAINAQGVTIHSFFQLNFGPQIPGTQKKSKRFQFRKNKIQLIRSLDLVVIDEISMVRADVLDAIDNVLRQYRRHDIPFGGVQMLLIGDVQQLAPVAKDEEWKLLSPYYETPYFFSSRALNATDFVTVELKHVYRQNDANFLELLNRVRTNTADEHTLQQLNRRYIPNFNPKKEDGYIRLTTHNYQADSINKRELDALNTVANNYEAVIEGDFPDMSFPTEKVLTLKVGAQVMFVKNDSSRERAYYNGMIGEVVEMTDNIITVHPTGAEKNIEVGQEKWENTKYSLDEETKEIREEIVGSFSQFPLKTAWAITVHKAQGLTFEHAIIDVQHSFAHGQTYVALSRCKTLEGMVLSTLIPRGAIICDSVVNNFSKDPRHQQPDEQQLLQMERQYYIRVIDELFSFSSLKYRINDMTRLMREYFDTSYPKLYNAWLEAADKIKSPEVVAIRFHNQYQSMVMESSDYTNDETIQERLRKGAIYFKQELLFIWKLLQNTNIKSNNKQAKERLANILQPMVEEYKIKQLLLTYVADNGFYLKDFLQARAKASVSFDDNAPATPVYSRKNDGAKNIKEWVKQYVDMNENSCGTDDTKLPY